MLSKEEKKGLIDSAMMKLASRRLWVWMFCTIVFLVMSIVYMSSTDLVTDDVMNHFADKWVDVSMVFIAVVGVQDIVRTLRGGD
jgi:hypothetical protein